MKKIKILFFLITIFAGKLIAQNDVLIVINGHKISKAEFERIYRKNNQMLNDKSAVKSPKEYVELYIDFKLKVFESLELKMDTAKSFREELAGYRAELASPYLTDMKYDETMVKELYERMKQELNASHILFRINEGAGEEQEKNTLQKAMQVRQEILDGKDFNQAAFEYSEDPSAKTNKGNLGYFSAFQMVTPFENQAFRTPVGQVSEPVRTKFGYHLIKIHDIRENQGEIKVAHIMKMFPREGAYDKSSYKAEIDKVYEKLLQGSSFEELVISHSDDKLSAADGGEMPWFTANRMIPEFSAPAFSLKNIGDITPPVETPFGYHIIKKIGYRPIASFEDMRAEIEGKIKNDPDRSSSTRKVFVEKLKDEYNFEESNENLVKIKNQAVDAEVKDNLLLFSFDAKGFYLKNFVNYLKKNQKNGLLSEHYDEWVEFEIIQVEDSKLEEKYPDFRYLMQEYHDGLLFFEIMEDKIWKFAAEDSAGLEKYYSDNKGKFSWDERFKGAIITCTDLKSREEAEKYFEAKLTFEEVEDLLNADEKRVDILTGAWEKGDNSVIDYYVWNGLLTGDINPELTFIRGDIIAPQPKTLDESRGLYISAYQDFLEKSWLKSLRKKYNVKINKKLLKTVPHV